MNINKKYFYVIASAAVVAISLGFAFNASNKQSFAKNTASKSMYLDITAEQLQTAMTGDGTFTVGGFDTWKVENVTFFDEGGNFYAKLEPSSVIYSTSTAGEEQMEGLHGTGYTAVTVFNKKSTATSAVYLLQDNGDAIYGEQGYVAINSGESSSYRVDLLTPYAKRLKFGGVTGEGNYLSFTSLRLYYECSEDDLNRYVNDGVYYWKRNISSGAISEKRFINWKIGEVEDGFRTDVSSDGSVMRNVSVWDGTSRSASLSGTGSEADPYLVTSANDLAYFSDTVFGGNNYSGKYIKMTVSVDVNNNCLFLSGYNHSFAGHFDGNNHSILNDDMFLSAAADGSANVVGLFRTVADNSSISNLIVSGSAVVGTHVGGFVGMANKVTISNSYNFVNVIANNYNAGGFIGNNLKANTTITNCVNFGSVTGKGNYETQLVNVGGIVGTSSNALIINNCSNFGVVTAQGAVGGLVGQGTGTISGSVNLGAVNCSGNLKITGAFVGKDLGATLTNNTSGDFACFTNAQNKKQEFDWTIGASLNGLRIDTNEFGGIRRISIWDGSSKSASLSGTGTAADPYLIQSANDLAYFADQVNSQNIYTSKTAKMINGVDLAGHALSIGGYAASVSFAGSFEGNQQFILGMNLTAADGANGEGNTIGLFPTVATTAHLQNLAIDGSVAGGSNVGALIGQTNSPYVVGCYNFCDVSATGLNVGGIAGNTAHAGAVITSCANFGTITSTENTDAVTAVGGIAGQLKAKIEKCENYGSVTARNYLGGIAGNLVNGTIIDSINFGSVNATSNTAGGIVGNGYGTLTSVVNNGTVTGTGYVGGVLGTQRNGALTATGCVNNGVVNGGNNDYVAGIIGCLVTNYSIIVSESENHGNITARYRVGGIVGGLFGQTQISLTNCSNSGTIKGSDRVGGIGGDVNGTYSACTNTGTITCSGSNKGDLFGAGTMTEQ